jgi:LysM repeat protein
MASIDANASSASNGADLTPPSSAANPLDPDVGSPNFDLFEASGSSQMDDYDESNGGQAYAVSQGDTLSQIALDHGVTLDALIAENPQIANPDLIFPNQQIQIPSGKQTADATAVNNATYVDVPPAIKDPLYSAMGRLATDTESDRNWIKQLNDVATQTNTIGSFDLSA